MALARCPMHALGCYLVQGLLERANTLMYVPAKHWGSVRWSHVLTGSRRLSISVKESMHELTEDLPPLVLVGGASRVMRHQLGQCTLLCIPVLGLSLNVVSGSGPSKCG